MSTADPIVLLVAQLPDPHVAKVQEGLTNRGARAVLLDRNHGDRVSCILNGAAKGLIRGQNYTIDTADVGAVWWRVKPASPAEFSGGIASTSSQFRWSEWRELLRSLPVMLPNVRWVNEIEPHYCAARKPSQLVLARSAGFTVPDTLISNDMDEILAFFRKHDRVIYKTLSSFMSPPNKIIYTNVITAEQIASDPAGVRAAPLLLQEYIEKAYELRVTVVGNNVFPVRIESQHHERTRVDWRRSQLDDMYTSIRLRKDVHERVLTYMEASRLSYGAIDLIVRPDGNHVFLECNPGGQWLWLENATHAPITAALVDLLSEAA